MSTWVWGVALLCGLASLTGGVWLLITAWRQSVLWFFGCLLIWPVQLLLLLRHWQVAWRPFALMMAPLGLAAGAVYLDQQNRLNAINDIDGVPPYMLLGAYAEYLQHQDHKALVFALDDDGRHVVGMAARRDSAEDAGQAAFEFCQQFRAENAIYGPCKLVALNDRLFSPPEILGPSSTPPPARRRQSPATARLSEAELARIEAREAGPPPTSTPRPEPRRWVEVATEQLDRHVGAPARLTRDDGRVMLGQLGTVETGQRAGKDVAFLNFVLETSGRRVAIQIALERLKTIEIGLAD